MVQPPADVDPFTRLGLAVAVHVDADTVIARRVALLDQVHPDRFAAHRDQARSYALQQAVAINDAARVLSDPLQRAEALMAQRRWSTAPTAPARPDRLRLAEYVQAIVELGGVDAHTERQTLERALAAEAQAALTTLLAAVASDATDRAVAESALAHLRGLRAAQHALAALDTTPDRSGRTRR